MKRDMDLIRELLLKIESDPRYDGTRWVPTNELADLGISGHSREEVGYHLTMLIEAGLIRGKSDMELMPVLNKLTWQGHEFLDDIRDHGIWNKTKERLRDVPSASIAVMVEIAKAELKKHLGLP